jgi:predicted type IV restriction endonuclease
MVSIPKKVAERLVSGVKRIQPIVAERKSADAGEADTVILVTEILTEVFGYDKFRELTSEFPVKNTYCDLATKLEDKIQMLIEVKAINHALKDSHVTQAVNYAANQGIKWVVLTNGQIWRAYAVKCAGQVNQDLVVEFDFLNLDRKSDDHLGLLYLLCKEGWGKQVIDEYEAQRAALNRFVVGAIILSDRLLQVVKTELRRVSPDVHLDVQHIKAVLETEVIKRELLEGEKADAAKKLVSKHASHSLREVKSAATAAEPSP